MDGAGKEDLMIGISRGVPETIGEHRKVDMINGKRVCQRCGQKASSVQDMRAVDCSVSDLPDQYWDVSVPKPFG